MRVMREERLARQEEGPVVRARGRIHLFGGIVAAMARFMLQVMPARGLPAVTGPPALLGMGALTVRRVIVVPQATQAAQAAQATQGLRG
jgi:hypothetical protein